MKLLNKFPLSKLRYTSVPSEAMYAILIRGYITITHE